MQPRRRRLRERTSSMRARLLPHLHSLLHCLFTGGRYADDELPHHVPRRRLSEGRGHCRQRVALALGHPHRRTAAQRRDLGEQVSGAEVGVRVDEEVLTHLGRQRASRERASDCHVRAALAQLFDRAIACAALANRVVHDVHRAVGDDTLIPPVLRVVVDELVCAQSAHVLKISCRGGGDDERAVEGALGELHADGACAARTAEHEHLATLPRPLADASKPDERLVARERHFGERAGLLKAHPGGDARELRLERSGELRVAAELLRLRAANRTATIDETRTDGAIRRNLRRNLAPQLAADRAATPLHFRRAHRGVGADVTPDRVADRQPRARACRRQHDPRDVAAEGLWEVVGGSDGRREVRRVDAREADREEHFARTIGRQAGVPAMEASGCGHRVVITVCTGREWPPFAERSHPRRPNVVAAAPWRRHSFVVAAPSWAADPRGRRQAEVLREQPVVAAVP
mmetsp:Transcript_14914/g.34129  ORF Transcript_14914/g.34129 Transcript_14914/m.34129 type:complete len:462 (-) Transcript_14914:184-1569(-)